MGSSQSALPAMEDPSADRDRSRDSETDRRQRRSEEEEQDEQQQQQQEQQQRQSRRSRRRRHETVVETSHEAPGDDPWWWEIENENLLLDRVPNVTAEPSANAVVAPLSDDFNTLLKIGQHVNSTLSNSNNKHDNHNNDDTANSEHNNNNNPHEDGASVDDDEIDPKGHDSEAPKPQPQPQPQPKSTPNDDGGPSAGHSCPEPAQSLDEFREELRQKRMARQTAVQDLRAEMATLRRQLAAERAVTRRLRNGEEADDGPGDEDMAEKEAGASENPEASSTDDQVDDDDANACSRGRHANIELANAQLALQLANSENISLRSELGVVQKQVGTLKEVVACCKQMLAMKEEQCVKLKAKLSDIEDSFGEREMKIMSDNLRQEYERQLANIRQLRQLYEERQRIAAAEHENLQRLISIKKDELATEQERTKTFEERNQALLKEVEAVNNELAALREECNEHKFEKKALKEEMGAVNTLFSQMVMGFNGKNNLDIDRLATMLEENRTLLNDMATKEANCSDGATLPKLLFELVEQAAVGGGSGSRSGSRSPVPGASDEDEDGDDGDGDGEGVQERARGEEQEGVGNGDEVDEALQDASNEESTVTSNNNNNNNNDDCGNADGCEVESQAVGAEAEDVQERRRRRGGGAEEGAGGAAEDNGINNCSNGSISSSSSGNNSANNVNGIGNKKHHHRKSAANKTKMSTSSTGAGADVAPSTARSLPSSSSSASAATFRLHEPEVIGKVASTQEIIGNLPKVWKVLMELLSHHKIEQVQFEENGSGEDCYKSVETPNGPKAELSVSKTYIKLKDLILEKKSLVKETNRLKTLNSHLDYRLNEQEKRLSAVSLELTKTWHLVGKMQRQHRQLHTQEQILRYQLQQKRRLLSELKDELEYCRRKWAAARAKNDESQEQCNDLRREFARRKLEDASNSAESGYSDSGPASDEDERGHHPVVATTSSVAATPSASASASASASGPGSSSGRGKGDLRERFEHSRKIKRMQSTSPGRAGGGGGEILLRWNSAPPTCGWRAEDDDGDDDDDDDVDDGESEEDNQQEQEKASSKGAVPKTSRTSRSKQRGRADPTNDDLPPDTEAAAAAAAATPVSAPPAGDRAVRIQRLEEQCKSLIQQVLETSDNRERLEIQLCRFQDEIAPVQYAMPLDQFLSQKRLERMTRASSAPATGALTPREEEYTRKRSERLGRLEEESRQLISRIKRTSDRGHYLRCSLERLHRAGRAGQASTSSASSSALAAEGAAGLSREGSFESNTEEEEAGGDALAAGGLATRVEHGDEEADGKEKSDREMETQSLEQEAAADRALASPLSPAEEAYTARRAERLRRLEEEGRQLLTRLSRNSQRGSSIETRLDTLHERHGRQNHGEAATSPASPTIEKRIANMERISSNRDERLRILEEEGKQLISRLSSTSERGTRMINHIAEREQSRLARQSETPSKEGGQAEAETGPTTSASATAPAANSTDSTSAPPTASSSPSTGATPVELDASEDAGVAGALLPTVKNVACSSIVCEELAECVTVTTTPSRIARPTQGAVARPHTQTQTSSKPKAQLSAAKAKAKPKKPTEAKSSDSESLEEMVRRLRNLPFPEPGPAEAEVPTASKEVATSSPEVASRDSAETAEDPAETSAAAGDV